MRRTCEWKGCTEEGELVFTVPEKIGPGKWVEPVPVAWFCRPHAIQISERQQFENGRIINQARAFGAPSLVLSR